MDKILTIEEIYNFELTTKDMLLGMPLLEKLYPNIITKTHWWFTTPCKQKIGAKRVNNKKRKMVSELWTRKMVSELWIKNGIRAMDNKKHTSRKLRKIRRKLNKLYPEYKLNITKTDNEKLNQLIDNISKIEYKYIQYLKIQ